MGAYGGSRVRWKKRNEDRKLPEVWMQERKSAKVSVWRCRGNFGMRDENKTVPLHHTSFIHHCYITS